MSDNERENIELNSNYVNASIKAHILPDKRMREIGFADLNSDSWYYFRTISTLDISFNVTIPKDGSDIRIDVIDEEWLQPYDYQYILSYKPDFKVALIVRDFVEEQMKFLQDNGVLSGHEYGEYI